MRKLIYLIVVIVALGLIIAGCIPVVPPAEKEKPEKIECATIQDGTIKASTGEIITMGYDEFGYNYQSHIFNGRYCDYDRVIGGAYCDVKLVMKWSDTWLSNKDCNNDTILDRGYSCNPDQDIPISSACAGAWVTNHQSGEYVNDDGETCEWTYFVKIVKAPGDAYTANNEDDVLYWYTADDIEIGSVIWGAYARIQQVENDACAGLHGLQYLSPASPGFGVYK